MCTLSIIVAASLILMLIIYLYLQAKEISALNRKNRTLEKNLASLDHQAKFIIQNDMELKLYQNAVHDKLEKLTFLKNFIGASINILDRETLFMQLNKQVTNAIGFEKACIFTFPELEIKINVGLNDAQLDAFADFINKHHTAIASLSQISSELDVASPLKKQLNFEDFLVGPVITGARIHALFIVFQSNISGGMTDAEKEVFSILCMYLGQCLDNITSFEALYHAGEELETRVKKKTFELSKTLTEIKKISKLKSDFISSVSHELRTPLTSIKGFSSLLVAEKFGILPPKAKERLKKIDDNVNKLVDMVNTLLDISRIESGKMEVKLAPSDICLLARNVTDFLSPQIEGKQLTVHMQAPGELFVYMDKHLIERVLINLINNAMKFTPLGGTISVSCRREDKKAIVSISDTGYGIPPADIDKIFQEFYRVDNPMNREIKGSGLGLSLVKKIITSHQGDIWLESEVDQGTTFYFTLKVVEDE